MRLAGKSWICSPYWERLLTGSLLLALLGKFLFQLGKGVQFGANAIFYLDAGPAASPLYPILIATLRTFMKENFALWLILLQFCIGMVAVFVLSKFLVEELGIPLWTFPIISYLLSDPYLTGDGRIGNTIYSEGLAYPLFLFAMRFMLAGLIRKDKKAFIQYLGLSALLVLTRKQFLFLYPISVMALSYLIYTVPFRWRNVIYLSLAFVCSVAAASIFERTLNYIRHGEFVAIPYSGVQLIVAPLYVSKPSDVRLFENDRERLLFRSVSDRITEEKLTWDGFEESTPKVERRWDHYLKSYNRIFEGAVLPIACRLYSAGDCSEIRKMKDVETMVRIDEVTRRMAFVLARENLARLSGLYLENVKKGFRGSFVKDNVWIWTQFLILAGSLFYVIKGHTGSYLVALVSSLVNMANVTAIATAEPTMGRYLMYTVHLQRVVLFILLLPSIQAFCLGMMGETGTFTWITAKGRSEETKA